MNLLYQLFNVFGNKEFTTKEIIKAAFGTFESGETELGDALNEVVEKRGSGISTNTRSIERFLITLVDGVSGGFTLQKRQSNITHWKIIQVEGEGDEKS
mgnify:CR=1 FL=1